MASFGENLRREREIRGVTLEEISAATKIARRSLEALELEDFSRLPGGIFNRSFVRAYARHLGLDEEKVLADYQLVAPAEHDPDLSRLNLQTPVPKTRESRGTLIGTLLAIALLSGGYLLYRYSHTLAAPKPQPAGTSRPAPAPSLAPSQAPPKRQHEATPAAEPFADISNSDDAAEPGAPENPPDKPAAISASVARPGRVEAAPAAKDGTLTLQVAAAEKAWVGIEADGRVVLQREISPREILTFTAKDSFDVITGNAQGIILTLNTETLKPLGRHGEVKKVHLTRSDLRNAGP